MSKLTLEKIAALAGVSRSTVSRVVNNHASVSPEVRKRVLQVIEETGYQPNLAARSLAARRSDIIGLVIPRIVQSLFTDPYFPRLIQGISQECNAHDFMLSLFLFHTADEEKKIDARVLRTGLIDGVIVSSAQIDDPLIPRLVQHEMPFVVVGRPLDVPQASFVEIDNVTGAYTAVSHLIRLGHKRIATITGPQNVVAGIERRQGYLNALNERHHPIDEALIVAGDFSEISGYLAMQRLLPHRPDALFAASDSMAFGAIRTLREASLSVPHDVAVVGYDDLPQAAVFTPPLTTVRQPIRKAGTQAVKILIDILESGPEPPQHLMLTTQLVVRESCGAT